MIRRLLPLVLVAACGDPPPMVLKFSITDGDVQSCTSSTGTKATSCDQVSTPCEAYVSIRIFAPNDPTAPFVSVCKPLAVGTAASKKNLCSIAQTELPPPAAPVSAQTLEVDITVYAKDSLHTDDMGNIVCPAQPPFGADGFPIAALQPCDPGLADCEPLPAVGGRAFYHPGDTETIVSLGCTNLEALQGCSSQNALAVSATVNDFDTQVSVSPATADGLLVSVGEPTASGSVFMLPLNPLLALERANAGPVPSWTGDFDLQLHNAVCLDVFEDGAQTTPVLTCTNQIAANPLQLVGTRLSTATLNKILGAVSMQIRTFDLTNGLVVGRVLDATGSPKPGVTITASDPMAHIYYLSGDLTSVVPASQQQQTTTSGVWISADAKFGTTFGTGDISALTQPGFGGLVQEKVDAVVLQFKQTGTGG